MKHLYQSIIVLYGTAVKIAAFFNPKARLFVEGRKKLLQTIQCNLAQETRPLIWMHCSSLGEFEQGRPLLEQIRKKYPHYALVLTFFSPSGYQVRKKFNGVDYVFYLPLDTSQNAKQFVLYVKPQLAIFVKYDLWLNYLKELQANQIPIILVDALFRASQPFFKWYGGLQRRMLQCFNWIFVQNEDSKSLLQKIGLDKVLVAGDTRFDRVGQISASTTEIEKMDKIAAEHKIIIAGSTWAEDEAMLADVVSKMPINWRLVVVPHEVDEERIKSVQYTFSKENTIRWSEWKHYQLKQKVLIVDTIGILSKLYKYASIAWIGGGLKSKGVHNVLEAAVYGVPCAYGPVHQKYQEAVELIQCGGAKVCYDSSDFLALLNLAEENPKLAQKTGLLASQYVRSKLGATDTIIDYLEEKNWLKTL